MLAKAWQLGLGGSAGTRCDSHVPASREPGNSILFLVEKKSLVARSFRTEIMGEIKAKRRLVGVFIIPQANVP